MGTDDLPIMGLFVVLFASGVLGFLGNKLRKTRLILRFECVYVLAVTWR